MTPEAIKQRTKQFALRCMAVAAALPGTPAGAALGKQILRSATSAGDNSRICCQSRHCSGRSRRKPLLAGTAQLLLESGLMTPKQLDNLIQEANELVAILITAKRNR